MAKTQKKDELARGQPMVPSVSHAMSILRMLGRAQEPPGVCAIARDLGLSPSSCFNLVKTLVHEDLVEFNSITKRYSLGLGLTEFARTAGRRSDVVKAAEPLMDALSERHDVTCGLWRLTRGQRLVLVAISESSATTRIHMAIGQRQPRYAGAAGRTVAAAIGASNSELAKELAKIRWQKPMSVELYADDVDMTNARGWALDEGCYISGVTSVGAAVCNEDREPRFCITASMFTGRHNGQAIEQVGSDVRAAAGRLAGALYGASQ